MLKYFHPPFIVIIGLAISSAVTAEVTELAPITVSDQTTQGGVPGQAPETTPSTSTLDTEASQIQLNITELKGVAGTQGDPLGAIKTLPGVVTASGGQGRSSGFFVRGSNANENLTWIDGLPVGYIYHVGGFYSILNPDLIDNFKTYLGGFGVEYGDRLGGVIDVRTRAPNSKKLSQSYQVGFYDSSARIEGPISENSSGYFAVRRSYIDLLLPTTGKLGDSDNTYTQFPQFWDLQAKYRYELENGHIELSMFSADDALKINLTDPKDINKDPALAGELASDTAFQTYGLNWKQPLTHALQQTLRVGQLKPYNRFQIGTQQASDPTPGAPYQFKQQGDTRFFLPQWQLTDDQNLWQAGVDYYQYRFNLSGYITNPCREGQPDCSLTESTAQDIGQTFDGDQLAGYMTLNRPLTDRLYGKFGLRMSRYDYGNSPYQQLSPRMTLEYDLNTQNLLTASWGQYAQVPQGNEISKSLGNPDLVMTQAEHRILGIKTQWNETWSSQIEIYQKPMRKLVVSRPRPENFANEGKGQAQGLDILLKRQWQNGAYGWLSYSYLESTRSDRNAPTADRLFDGDQPHTLNMVWAQPFSGNWSKWTWGLSLKVQSGQPYTEVIGRGYIAIPNSQANCSASTPNNTQCYWNPIYGKTNGNRLPFQTRLDLSMARQVKYQHWDLEMRFELLNLTSLFYADGNTIGYEYEADYANYNNPDTVSGLPFLPSFSIRGNF
ncbi:MAG: hypothetical protein COZ36_09730 [Piscirickettsiaceae bacterium CG_4_10_14_3_um_filter_44_349]|nr:TonB-dependent receptor [Thiomicrospira sp.]PIQ05230.1 MAG: hypothetical protein COW74_02995 [Piscirickettsiaceae bacterium CG18_big_fil_WC_8_21_14_2_50_44_103]PIU39531.1 MAG: hypothetical protein COT01_00915 [Piscirickettsiaceae bacterium CG07_land_8_20_14_0_80_44_28]PIW57760.1 MAG: hypothetical protein COW14_04330 [Piscirickettsiaceae bacterium CG12_big_fil_rev_8_21_14_0_65_44_934]PIW77697.1 MAG: hypothetical protein CO000_05605 [Piscirickettsiaceae bacterium CG_4_8_14_3_um_filter_44_38]P